MDKEIFFVRVPYMGIFRMDKAQYDLLSEDPGWYAYLSRETILKENKDETT